MGLFGVYGLLRYCNAWAKGALEGFLLALDGKCFEKILCIYQKQKLNLRTRPRSIEQAFYTLIPIVKLRDIFS